jgi:hypothetical protein
MEPSSPNYPTFHHFSTALIISKLVSDDENRDGSIPMERRRCTAMVQPFKPCFSYNDDAKESPIALNLLN